jgi:hypothetical protein
LTVPDFLKTAEKAIFIEQAALNPHLTAGDVPMLAAYAQAISNTHRLARSKDITAWEKTARVAMALARALRLTAISGVSPDRLARQRRDYHPSAYSLMAEEEDDDDR